MYHVQDLELLVAARAKEMQEHQQKREARQLGNYVRYERWGRLSRIVRSIVRRIGSINLWQATEAHARKTQTFPAA